VAVKPCKQIVSICKLGIVSLEITQLLVRVREGDAQAREALFPAVYRDLENIAKAHVRGGMSIEPRGLVHELYLKLMDAALDARDRKHFYAIAALAMRQILVDRARRRSSRKRGGDHAERVTLSQLASDEPAFDGFRAEAAIMEKQIADLLGTPLNMSPEQALGRASQVDTRTVIYSLGVILFELVAGRPPYELQGLSLPLAVRAITTTPPAHRDDPKLDAIGARALAKAPAERFASAAVRAC
jgi:RNA polymerase sigma factor (TIGR02999 family)